MRFSIPLMIALLATANSASADIIDNITIQTASLIGHPAGPFSLELQFNDGNGTGDANNTAILSEFTFGGGSASGVPSVVGGVTGDLGSSITMTDSSFFNQFIQGFSPGTSLSFQLALTTNLDSGFVPDEFSLSILDSSGVEIPTLSPANAFLVIDIDSGTPSTSAFTSDTSQSPNAGGPPINISAPVVSVAPSAVPEPSGLLLTCTALSALFLTAWHRAQKGVFKLMLAVFTFRSNHLSPRKRCYDARINGSIRTGQCSTYSTLFQ